MQLGGSEKTPQAIFFFLSSFPPSKRYVWQHAMPLYKTVKGVETEKKMRVPMHSLHLYY